MIFKSPEAVCQPTNVIPPVWQVQCCVMIFWAEQSTELLSDSQNLLSESSRKLKKEGTTLWGRCPNIVFVSSLHGQTERYMRERGMTGGQQGGGRVPPIGQTNTLHFLLTTDKKKKQPSICDSLVSHCAKLSLCIRVVRVFMCMCAFMVVVASYMGIMYPLT